VQAALGTPRQGELSLLHHTPELTVVNVVWVPGMTAPPHNHRMWALIGLYGGQEDNTFYRTGPDGLTVAGARQLVTCETALLGTSIIHSVTNPLRTLTGAIHVYGGDFVNAPRSEWESGQERPYRAAWAKRIMAEANQRCAPSASPRGWRRRREPARRPRRALRQGSASARGGIEVGMPRSSRTTTAPGSGRGESQALGRTYGRSRASQP